MKTIFLKTDLDSFIREISNEVEKDDVLVSMYGYKAIVYKGSSLSGIKIGILRKLKAIREYETNLDILRKHSGMSDEQFELIESYTPDQVADLCFEMGLVVHHQKIM